MEHYVHMKDESRNVPFYSAITSIFFLTIQVLSFFYLKQSYPNVKGCYVN
jgi:hypothetical protein